MRERAPGVWDLTVSTGERDSAGRYRRVTRRHHGDEKAAAKALARLVVEVEDGKHPARTPATMTVGDLLADWQARRAHEWAPKTIAHTADEVERLLLPRLGSKRVARVTPAQIETALADIATSGKRGGKPVAASTVRRVRSYLVSAWKDAVRLGIVDRSPMERVRGVSVPRARHTGRTVADFAAAGEIEDPWLAGLVRVALVTGARRGELAALRWTDVDLEAGTVTFERAISAGARELHERGTKTGSTKTVRIDPGTVELLRSWCTTQKELGLAVGKRWRPSWRVWPAPEEFVEPVHPDLITGRWRRWAAANGLAGVRFHDLRHATATTMIAAGVDPRTVADHLGHSTPTITLSVYAAAVPAAQQAAVDLLGQALDRKN